MRRMALSSITKKLQKMDESSFLSRMGDSGEEEEEEEEP